MWNAIPAPRLACAAGILLHLAVFVAALRVGLIITLPRIAVALAAVVSASVVSKFVFWNGHLEWLYFDLFIMVPVLAVYFLRRRIASAGLAVLACAALSNVVFFASYNPVQLAGPIFAKHDTDVMRVLAAMQAAHPRGWLIDAPPAGAILNGLGFRAIKHSLLAPQLAFFRQRFPNLDEAEFNTIFNRYAHVAVSRSIDRPRLLATDGILVPYRAFE